MGAVSPGNPATSQVLPICSAYVYVGLLDTPVTIGESLGPEAFGLVQLASKLAPTPTPPPESWASLPLAAPLPWVALVLPLALALMSTSPLSMPTPRANVRS